MQKIIEGVKEKKRIYLGLFLTIIILIFCGKDVFATNKKLIMVGDSRTFNMSNWVKTSAKTTFVAKSGQGYQWFVKEGIPKINECKRKGDCIVVWLGVNDYRLAALKKNPYQLYAAKLNRLAKKEWKDCKVYVVSVGYVDEKRIQNYFHKHNRSNTKQIGKVPVKGIYDFNNKLKKSLNSKIKWIDIRDVIGIKENAKRTKANIWVTRKNGQKDGLHYSPAKTQEIYDYIVSHISL
ncbi:hypothetical protein lbkm_1623 [Lachnospiraceae bacterium KM106-2]|nr:hypothetical protein lbkm_1623 [Lachnospiraceae bacterium KM106-2]